MSECDMFTLVNEYDEIVMNQSGDKSIKRKYEIFNKTASEKNKYEMSEIKNYELLNDIVYKKCLDERRLFAVPRAMRKGLAIRFHDLKSHPGLERSIAMLTEHYYFSEMRKYLRRHIGAYIQCALTSKNRQTEWTLASDPEQPFAVLILTTLGHL